MTEGTEDRTRQEDTQIPLQDRAKSAYDAVVQNSESNASDWTEQAFDKLQGDKPRTVAEWGEKKRHDEVVALRHFWYRRDAGGPLYKIEGDKIRMLTPHGVIITIGNRTISLVPWHQVVELWTDTSDSFLYPKEMQ